MEENTDVVIPSTEVSPEVPLATRLHMANDELQLSKQKYMQIDDAVMASYDEIISKYTPKQLKFKQEAESGVTSDTLEIGRSTYENFIINTLNLPEKLVMATGNIMTLAPDGKVDTVGKQWASWASQAINDYVDANYLSENPGDSDTWTAKITGGILSAAEYMALGYVGGAILANSVMGADVLGNSTMNDIDRYIAETGDTTLSRYNADWKDVALNILNTGAQVYIEDKLGFGRALKLKSAGASEALAGFSQEFLQGEIDDVVEAFKKNKSWEDVLKGFVGNIKDGVIGGALQGATGMASHQHYVSVAERNMTDFLVKNGMDEKTAQQEAHKLRIRFEKEIAPQVFKRGKDIYDLVTQKGAVWGSVYDVAYNAIRLTDDMSMTADEIQNRATEIADQIASKVIDSIVENGTNLADVRIGFNPVDNSVYVNDKKSLDVKQALKEIQELDAEPATKEDVKKAVEEGKKAEEKTETEKQKPVSAVDPKAPFNKTKEKSPVFKQLQLGLEDGSIKLNKTEQNRYSLLLKDKLNNKPTTNAQMDLFAEKMVQKYAPATQTGTPAVAQPTTEQVARKPNKYDTGAKKASKMSESLKQKAPAELAQEMAREMDGEYNQRMTKDAVTDAVNFALSSEENMQIAIDAIMNMKEVDGIRPFEMYAGLMLIATKYNHPLLFEQLRNSPIHQSLARQAGQDISALQFTTESGMINVMKVVDSLDRNVMTPANKKAVEKSQAELAGALENIEYTDEETTNAIEELEC